MLHSMTLTEARTIAFVRSVSTNFEPYDTPNGRINGQIELNLVPTGLPNNAFREGQSNIMHGRVYDTILGTMGRQGTATSAGELILTGSYVGIFPENDPYLPEFALIISFEAASL